MCGLSGYLAFSGPVEDAGILRRMNAALTHRGPDGEGLAFIRRAADGPSAFTFGRSPLSPSTLPEWTEGLSLPHDLALGHRRFAILDLTPHGHQPFISEDGRYVLTFHGEIYNHTELREELSREGHVFKTRGDAEVLLRAFLHWREKCFAKLRGFWALAIWDAERRALLLSRDRMGKAPLYYARHEGKLWWSSEIKGLLAGAPALRNNTNSEAVRRFVVGGLRDFGDETFYEGIRTFPRAAYAWVDAAGNFEPQTFWELPARRLSPQELSPEEAASGLRERLEAAVKLRLRADAPLGLELSGGLDSSAIAALAATGHTGEPLQAFTVSFPGTAWDESPFARKVAERYPNSLRLQTLVPESGSVLNELSGFHAQMDEPIHSPNMILNRDIWKRMAALGIRVSLNGAAGDEMLAGYASEYFGPYMRRLLVRGNLPRAFHELWLQSERASANPVAWLRQLWSLLPESTRQKLRPNRPDTSLDPLLLSREPLPMASNEIEKRLTDNLGPFKMNYWLRSGNAASMGVPMEVRLPFLDADVAEWACRLPVEYLIRDGWLKWALRKAVDPLLPAEVVWRKVKMGFPFPLAEWLRESRPGFEYLRRGEGPFFLDREKLFASYDALVRRHPAYLWRCLSALLWWENCVIQRRAA